jgi:uncharacterized membrane protein
MERMDEKTAFKARVVYGALPGAVVGALLGAYHRELSLKYDASRWPGMPQGAPWGWAHGLVLGALGGALVFGVVRRLWPRLPAPMVAALTAGCVAMGGLVLSASRVD